MADTTGIKLEDRRMMGVSLQPGVTRLNYFFLFVNTFIMGILMVVPSVIQPAFMKDIIRIDQNFAGSVNSFLQNMSQVATLAFVAIIGALSDRKGRKVLIFLGMVLVGLAYIMFMKSNDIASILSLSPMATAAICASLSFMPGRAAEFVSFAPGLLVSYVARFLVGIGLILGYPQLVTLVGDYAASKDRGKGMAMNGMGIGFAAILVFGIFGSIIRKSGVVSGIATLVVIAAIGAVLTLVFLAERKPGKVGEKQRLRDVLPLLRKSRTLRVAYVCAMITRADIIVLGTYLVAWGVKAGTAMGLSSGKATIMATIPMMLEGAIAFIAFPLIGVLLDKWGRLPTILMTVLLGGVGMLLLGFSPTPFGPLCYIAAALIGIGQAGATAGANTLAIDGAPKSMMGTVMGGLTTMQPLGVLAFLGLGGYFFDKFSPGSAFVLKGAGNIVLFVWLLFMRSAIAKEKAA